MELATQGCALWTTSYDKGFKLYDLPMKAIQQQIMVARFNVPARMRGLMIKVEAQKKTEERYLKVVNTLIFLFAQLLPVLVVR